MAGKESWRPLQVADIYEDISLRAEWLGGSRHSVPAATAQRRLGELKAFFEFWRLLLLEVTVVRGISMQDALARQRQWKSWQLEWTGLA